MSVLNILNMLYNLHFFSSKCRLFHNATLFGFCITHILNTRCAKIWKKKKIRRQKVNMFTARFPTKPIMEKSVEWLTRKDTSKTTKSVTFHQPES